MTACSHYYEGKRTDIRARDSNIPTHLTTTGGLPSIPPYTAVPSAQKRQDREIVATLTHQEGLRSTRAFKPALFFVFFQHIRFDPLSYF
ncbi:hypothetical protein COCC4DRAFT_149815 [Bipolaris maydis ATCC 48331]|uniref:Uncharacterized protein n=2 Tax=Cochliobolus heterostrophus TaxID=5016 RepID=M2U3Y2_COCH5|nr:uncharacterized protein COCC4DRAFT_149815 [Bipolaris maydis ATCC 48331]EMD88441.1 hypothetical protein COCHEDRAFT_1196454 [Bipolaris maydis C5]ENI00720.1 hypothetical protein COCC4DRAFT_149815 [Bipolaris maydis ATCC 48331]